MITKRELSEYIKEHIVEYESTLTISKLSDGSFNVLIYIKIDSYDEIDFAILMKLLEILSYIKDTLNLTIEFAANKIDTSRYDSNPYNAKSFIDYKKSILQLRFKIKD